MDNQVKIEDAWLNIDIDEKNLFNPLSILSSEDPDEFQIHLAWLMSNPEYFSFIVKNIFNIDLLPVQALMLKEILQEVKNVPRAEVLSFCWELSGFLSK